jgi:transposase
MDGLGVRSWVCPDCGAEHDCDINAAVEHTQFRFGVPNSSRRNPLPLG